MKDITDTLVWVLLTIVAGLLGYGLAVAALTITVTLIGVAIGILGGAL